MKPYSRLISISSAYQRIASHQSRYIQIPTRSLRCFCSINDKNITKDDKNTLISDSKKSSISGKIPRTSATTATTTTSATTNTTNASITDDEKVDYKRVIPVALSSLLTGLAIGIIVPVMPIFARDLGLSTAEYGLIVSVMGLSRLMANIPAAWAAEKYGRRPLLIGGPAITAIGVTLTGMCTSAVELVSVRFMAGMGGSFSMTGSSLYLADISNPKNRARTLAPGLTAFVAGFGLGPGIGGFMVDNVGPTPAFFTVGAVISCAVVANYLFLPETKVWPKKKENDTASTTAAANSSPLKVIVDEFKSQIGSWKEILKDTDLRYMVMAHTAYWTCSSAVSFTMLPMLATGQFGMSGSLLGSCFAASALIQFLGAQPAAMISDRFGRKTTLIPGALIVGSSAILMPHMSSMEEFVAVMLVSSLGGTLWGSSSQSFMSDKSKPEIRAQALALHRSGGDLGIFIGAGCVGLIADLTSNEVSMGTMGGMLITAIVIFARRASEVRELK